MSGNELGKVAALKIIGHAKELLQGQYSAMPSALEPASEDGMIQRSSIETRLSQKFTARIPGHYGVRLPRYYRSVLPRLYPIERQDLGHLSKGLLDRSSVSAPLTAHSS